MVDKIIIKPIKPLCDILFFNEVCFSQFENRVIPLFGPNGVGKSSFINALEEHGRNRGSFLTVTKTNDKPINFFSYINGKDNLKSSKEPRSHRLLYDPMYLKMQWDAKGLSEGQSVMYSLYDLLDGLKPGAKGFDLDDNTDYIIALDEIESGLSIDNIDVTMRKIKSIIKRPNIQIVFSFNSPRVLKWFPDVLSMYDGTKIHLESDEDMIREIRAHAKDFNKVRKKSNGRPKIYD